MCYAVGQEHVIQRKIVLSNAKICYPTQIIVIQRGTVLCGTGNVLSSINHVLSTAKTLKTT